MHIDRLLARIVIIVLVPLAQAGTVIHVDDDNCPGPGDGSELDPYCSIQTAIDAATGSEEIVVAPGTYFENIDFLGKAITVRSSAGRDVTTIDAQGSSSAVTAWSGEGPDTTLDGFTVTGGSGQFDFGGGMFISNSSPTVTNCTFRSNHAALAGGGMWASAAAMTLVLQGCRFEMNTTENSGGGAYLRCANLVVSDCQFLSNHAGPGAGLGAGLLVDLLGDVAEIRNCEFADNSTSGTIREGGGAFLFGTAVDSSVFTVDDCVFLDNMAGRGAGVIFNDAELILSDSRLANNVAAGGAAFELDITGAASVANSVFCNNSPADIEAPWEDKGGNCFADECTDGNDNGIPDECDCVGDVSGDGMVSATDLLSLLGSWHGTGPADLNGDGTINTQDLLVLLAHWGPCSS